MVNVILRLTETVCQWWHKRASNFVWETAQTSRLKQVVEVDQRRTKTTSISKAKVNRMKINKIMKKESWKTKPTFKWNENWKKRYNYKTIEYLQIKGVLHSIKLWMLRTADFLSTQFPSIYSYCNCESKTHFIHKY